MTVAAPGKRYYPNEMTGFSKGKAALAMLSDCKIRAYNNLYRRLFEPEKFKDPFPDSARPVYENLRSFGLSSLYANSMEPFVKGILKSQMSNIENRISKLEDDIDSMQNKLDDLREELSRKCAIKESIVRFSRGGEWVKPYPKCTVTVFPDGILQGFSIDPVHYLVYERKLDKSIRRTKRRMTSIREGIRRREHKKAILETGVPTKAIFGSRALFRKKDTVCKKPDDVEAWKEEFYRARHSSCTLSGRADSVHGNYIVKWNERTMDLTWRLPDGTDCVFPEYTPVNYADEFRDCLRDKNCGRHTVAYTIELRKDSAGREYFLVWASFSPPADPYMNFSTVDGIISVDINVD